MLNRLYIVIGVLAILVLGAGFIVPHLIDWNGYRERMESLAEASFGTDVIIGGDIEFTLLPQPRLVVGKTFVGPAFSPLLEIDSLVAELSLMDFLRDRFVVTKLVLQSPIVNITIDKNGNFENPLNLTKNLGPGNVSVADAKIIDGLIRLDDKRSEQHWQLDQFNGELSISDLGGPYSLKGSGVFDNEPHALRLSLSAINQDQLSQASFFLRPNSGKYVFSGDGILDLGENTNFLGQVLFKSTPLFAQVTNDVRGDFVFASEVEISPHKILLTSFELQPDENQAGSRLSGAAVVNLGETQNFDAVISGGVVSFAPKDIRVETSSDTYALIEFLAQLSTPILPLIPGRIGVDIAELNVQNFALRNVRLDMKSGSNGWEIENFFASLAGESQLHLTGLIGAGDGPMTFLGKGSIEATRIGMLARLWRDVADGNPLQNQSGIIEADISLGEGILEISQGKISMQEQNHEFSGTLVLNAPRSAAIEARIAPINQPQSEMLLALLPQLGTQSSFTSSFPSGHISVSAEQVSLLEIEGKSMALQMDWDPQGIQIERISAFDFGGAQFSLSGEILGDLTSPNLLGGGRITLSEDARSGVLQLLPKLTEISPKIQSALAQTLPLDMNIDMSPAQNSGEQIISAMGRSGLANIEVLMRLEKGVFQMFDAPVSINASIHTDDADGFFVQLGLGDRAILGQGESIDLGVSVNGIFSGKLDATIEAKSASENLAYSGNLFIDDLGQIEGQGRLDFSVQDFSALQELAGVEGLFLPASTGSAEVSISRSGLIVFDEVALEMFDGGQPAVGQFTFQDGENGGMILGQASFGVVDIAQVASIIAGPSSQITAEPFWPVGPFDLGAISRHTNGRLAISSSHIVTNGRPLISDASFDLIWDETSISLENIQGESGGGNVSGSLTLCCAGLTSQKQMRGRLAIDNVPSGTLLPDGINLNVDGLLTAGLSFESTGASIDELVSALSGEGSFSLNQARFFRMDPTIFSALVSEPDLGEMDADALTVLVGIALEQGDFWAENVSGLFQIAGGTLRAENLFAHNDEARLSANVRVDLSDLELSGSWSLTPSQWDDSVGLLDQNSAQITASLSGTLQAPARDLDLRSMADAIELRGLEIELDQLETLRAEQAARSAELALNRAKLMEAEELRAHEEAERAAAQEEQDRLDRAAAAAAAENASAQDPLVFDFDSQDPLLTQDQPFLNDGLVFNDQPTDLLAQ